MIRRSVPRGLPLRASGDRWLFGYADVVTLLFACFASLYASRLAPGAIAAAAPVAIAPVTMPPATPAISLEMPSQPSSDLLDRLTAVVGSDPTFPGIEISDSHRGLVISLPEAGSFPQGQAEFSPTGRQMILNLAATLRDLPNLIRVEGHTDNTPIHHGAFASNWELSTARATRVVQFLIEECGVDPARLSAAGYAEHRPRVPNDSSDDRARNRRVDIVVLDPAATREEPGRVDR